MVEAGVGFVVAAMVGCVASLLVQRYQRAPVPDGDPMALFLVVLFLLGAGVATLACSRFL